MKLLDGGESLINLSKEFRVGITTIKDWKKNRTAIVDFGKSFQTNKSLIHRKTIKNANFRDIDEAVHIWFLYERILGNPVTGPIIKAKALRFKELLKGKDNFKVSEGCTLPK